MFKRFIEPVPIREHSGSTVGVHREQAMDMVRAERL